VSPLLPLPVTLLTLRPPRRLFAGGVLSFALAGLLTLAGCAAPAVISTPAETAALARLMAPASAASASASATTSPLRYTLNVGDEFDVKVPDAPQLEQTLRVRPDGKVSLPLIGTVHVQGRTPDDVQDELRERLAALAGQSAGREYLLHANDELEIKFPYHPTLNEALRVRPDGKLQLQLVGTVQAEGRSPEDLRTELKQRYAKWLRNPELSVIVRTATSQSVRIAGGGAAGGRAGLAGLQPVIIVRNAQATQVFVGGEVTRPGVLTWRPGLSLVQAVVESGGALPSGDRQQLAIVRRGGPDGPQVLRIGTQADPLAQPAQDVLLEPFDVVLLPKGRAANLADNLNLYVFNLVPLLRNSSFSFAYNLRNSNAN
jgi:protein involved in polysaccharide export with SLBB domain